MTTTASKDDAATHVSLAIPCSQAKTIDDFDGTKTHIVLKPKGWLRAETCEVEELCRTINTCASHINLWHRHARPVKTTVLAGN